MMRDKKTYRKELSYIYEDDRDNKKYIGEIKKIEAFHYVTFQINTGTKTLDCVVEDIASIWRLHITTLDVITELSTLDDIFWNSEQIIKITRDYISGIAVAVAIHKISKNNGIMFE